MNNIASKLSPGLLYPRRKPVERVEIDLWNPINEGLVGCWLLGQLGYTRDLAENNHGNHIGDQTLVVRDLSDAGAGTFINANSSQRIDLGTIGVNNPLQCARNNQFTIFSHLFINNDAHQNDFARIIDKSSAGNAANGYAMYVNNPTGGFLVQVDAGVMNSFSYVDPIERVGSLACVYDPSVSQTARGYHNGKLAGEVTGVTVPVPKVQTGAALLNWPTSTSRVYKKPVYLIMVWDRALNELENAQLAKAPYAGFVDARKLFVVPNVVVSEFTNVSASGSAQSSGSATASSQSSTTDIEASGSAQATGTAQTSTVTPIFAGGSSESTGSVNNTPATTDISASGSAQSTGSVSAEQYTHISADGSAQSTGLATVELYTDISASGSAQASGSASVSPIDLRLVTTAVKIEVAL